MVRPITSSTQAMMASTGRGSPRIDRRTALRYPSRIPATIFLGLAALPEPARTRDISSHGFFVYSSGCDPVGSVVDIVLELPSELASSESRRVRYRARIVRREPQPDGSMGFAAAITGCRILTSDTEDWETHLRQQSRNQP